MINWLKKTWSNKFIRDRIFALTFLVVMFTGFWHAYHANSDYQKLVGLVPGLISLMAILALVFEDFDPNDPDQQTGGRFGEHLKKDDDEEDKEDGDGDDDNKDGPSRK